jgi:type I restriction enzyme S subunit
MSEWKGTEIGLIPPIWKIKALDNYIQKNRGICYGVVQPGFHDETGIPIIRVNNLKNGSIVSEDILRISPEIESKYSRSRLTGNEILISLVGNVGEIVVVDSRYKGWNVARAVGVIPVSDNIDKEWLKYWLQSSQVKHYISTHCNTTVQITLNLKDVSELPILEPSLDEQKWIASIPSLLDRKISNLRQQNETLEKIAQTLFKHWFVDFEFPNEDGKPYRSSGGEMVRSEDLGEIPAGWRVGKLGDEIETLGGGTPSTQQSEYWIDGDIPWYSPTDLTKSKTLFSLGSEKQITRLGLGKSSAKLFPKYSLLLTSRATIGEITINTQDACTNQGFITLVPNEIFSVYFLHGWLLTQINLVKQLASGSTFPELSKSSFRNFLFLIPESNQLVQHEQMIKPVFQKIETNIKQIQTLTKTRDRLLPKLMSGQLRIPQL